MSLPKISSPLFSLILPSTNKEIKFRPFKVKEEKILLIAGEMNDKHQAILAIKQILQNCLIDIDIETLSMFDIEYIMLNLRAKSVDNIVNFIITDPETKEKKQLELNLDNIKVVKDPDHTNAIKIDDTYTLFLRYPSLDEFNMLLDDGSDTQTLIKNTFNIMIACADKLVSAEDIFYFKDFSFEEKESFFEDLGPDTIIKIKKFFDTMPKIRHEINYINSKGNKKTFVLEGLDTFFL
jgi:hypothetical protein